jgi:hypothetical protein
VIEDSWEKDVVTENPVSSSYAGSLLDSTLTFDVTPTIQGWIGNNYKNNGFLVRSFSEEQTLGRVAFYATRSSVDFQPKLYLYYTISAKQEF